MKADEQAEGLTLKNTTAVAQGMFDSCTVSSLVGPLPLRFNGWYPTGYQVNSPFRQCLSKPGPSVTTLCLEYGVFFVSSLVFVPGPRCSLFQVQR